MEVGSEFEAGQCSNKGDVPNERCLDSTAGPILKNFVSNDDTRNKVFLSFWYSTIYLTYTNNQPVYYKRPLSSNHQSSKPTDGFSTLLFVFPYSYIYH